ncbi:MAG TPA: MmcQ/YjbR family DNA-binding protein [Steroidobacteraceae bacterium]|nr:MmcQ/YjbR family DNA-binding protein [Steroidobacteraceae bacterium]
MTKDLNQAVREVCLSFPEAEEYLSHGSPNFRVRGKTFATYVVNHHGDGRIALWLNAPPGSQEQHTRAAAKHFFVPPYVGPRGWLGVQLDKGLSWQHIAALVREAYEKVAPRALSGQIGKTIEIEPPTGSLAPSEFDPLSSKRAQSVLKSLRKICLSLPETSEALQFGSPVWKAGKKTFACAYYLAKALKLAFWVGVDRQGLLTADERFQIPQYMGHNGWIALDVTRHCDWQEVGALALDSYRHFALRRMLTALGEA